MSFLAAIAISCGAGDTLAFKQCKLAVTSCMRRYAASYGVDNYGPRYCAEQFFKRRRILGDHNEY